jgi:uncharacterized protein
MEKILAKYDDFFVSIALPIIEHDEYQKMRIIPHHQGSVFEHSLDVAYLSYRMASRLRLDVVSTIRALCCMISTFINSRKEKIRTY